jgi:hypothetical protein
LSQIVSPPEPAPAGLPLIWAFLPACWAPTAQPTSPEQEARQPAPPFLTPPHSTTSATTRPICRCWRRQPRPWWPIRAWGLRMRLKARGIKPAQEFIERRQSFEVICSRPCACTSGPRICSSFVPLLLAHALTTGRLLTALLAFCCFSLTASAAYIVNDLLDIEADRRHPASASGPLPRRSLRLHGLLRVTCFCCGGLSGARLLPVASTAGCFSTWPQHSGLLSLSEAHCAGGCAGALRLVYSAPAGGQRRNL